MHFLAFCGAFILLVICGSPSKTNEGEDKDTSDEVIIFFVLLYVAYRLLKFAFEPESFDDEEITNQTIVLEEETEDLETEYPFKPQCNPEDIYEPNHTSS